jgi:vacuolar-type H+-ATPase subunit E/Vma4
LFDEETNVIKAADEAAQETIDRSWKESKQKKVEAENRITVEKVNNNYRD